MAQEIPTAETVAKKWKRKLLGSFRQEYTDKSVENACKEFAKLHVKAALKAASQNVSFKSKDVYPTRYSSMTGGSKEVNLDSILNAYPDKLIQ